MTGYGRGECELHDRTITVELRAVNNRYLDCSVKIPRVYVFAEEAIKSQVQKQVGRGKVDVFVAVDSSAADQVAVTLNRPVADGYYAALKQMRDVYDLKDDLSVSLLSRFPDVFLVEKEQGDADVIAQDIVQVLSQALEDFNAMRQREGEKLAEDILGKAQRIRQLVTQVEERSPATVAEYREKLRQRMEEVLSNTQIDESRILTEAAIFADKVAVDEETVRLRSHLSQLEEMLREGGAIGRKLDFLIQEFNREANTIGSKCSDVELARVVVELKGEIEKIREQVQNIE
ncbi:MAG: YicC/YloC family endoribonuclease [Evtepia sp.]|nr:YicC/YloC family endoribonuclease [Evtepia sp.]